MAIKDWSTTAASNANVGSINWAEGQAPSTVNNSSREMMAEIAKYLQSLVLNVKDYGALGDGSTNDTSAIQTALTVAENAGGGIVFVPEGTFKTNALTVGSNVTLTGTGYGSILKLNSGINDSVITNVTNAVSIEISNLTIDGAQSQQTSTSSHGIELDNSGGNTAVKRHFVHHVYILSTKGDGLKLGGFVYETIVDNVNVYFAEENGFNITSADCQFSNLTSGQTGKAGFLLNSASGCMFTGCKAWYAGRNSAADGVGFNIRNSPHVTLSACWSQDNQAHGFSLFGQSGTLHHVTLSGCLADSDNQSGGTSHGVTMNDCQECYIQINIIGQRSGISWQISDGINMIDGSGATINNTIIATGRNVASFLVDYSALAANQNYIVVNDVPILPQYIRTSMPTGYAGAMCICTNAADGHGPAFYDGSAWRSVETGNAV